MAQSGTKINWDKIKKVATDKHWGDDALDYGLVTIGIRAYDLGVEP